MFKSKKCLPISDPSMNALPEHAELLAVLECYDETEEWILKNFIQITSFYDKEHLRPFWVSFTSNNLWFVGRLWEICPYLKIKTSKKEFVKREYKTFSDFVIQCINDNEYIFVFLTTSYFKRFDLHVDYHPVFISGYDLAEESLLCSDFFGTLPKFTSKWIPMNDVNLAYDMLDDFRREHKLIDDFDGISLWKYTNTPISPYLYQPNNFKIKHIEQKILEYLNIHINRDYMNEDANFYIGNQVYDVLISYLKNVISNNDSIDIRPICVLEDHKKLLCRLSKYMNIKYKIPIYYYNEFNRFLFVCTKIKLMIIKYKIYFSHGKNNLNIFYNIIEYIEVLKDEESQCLVQLCKELSKIE